MGEYFVEVSKALISSSHFPKDVAFRSVLNSPGAVLNFAHLSMREF
jgi:hypothetical protein